MTFKPMLSPNEDPLKFPDYFKKLRYPLLVSPKYDGIRCIVKSGNTLSRSGKVLPSLQVQEEFRTCEHLDGEIIEGCATDFDVYNRTQSYVMSEKKKGQMSFYVFDYTHPDWLNKPFYQRLDKAFEIAMNHFDVFGVSHYPVDCYDELLAFEHAILERGFEGIMMRDPVGHYKNGRGTFKEGLIYKLKRFQDDEAIILDFVERQKNENTLEADELGYAKRSTKKEGMVGAGTLGKFICNYKGEEIEVAPGSFTHAELQEIWDEREEYKGQILKFRFFAHGIKDKPRFPRALGFRNLMDL